MIDLLPLLIYSNGVGISFHAAIAPIPQQENLIFHPL